MTDNLGEACFSQRKNKCKNNRLGMSQGRMKAACWKRQVGARTHRAFRIGHGKESGLEAGCEKLSDLGHVLEVEPTGLGKD